MSIEESLIALHNAVVSQGGTLYVRMHGVDMDVVEGLANGQYAKEAVVNRSLTAVENEAMKQVVVSISARSLSVCASSESKPATSADFIAQAEKMLGGA